MVGDDDSPRALFARLSGCAHVRGYRYSKKFSSGDFGKLKGTRRRGSRVESASQVISGGADVDGPER